MVDDNISRPPRHLYSLFLSGLIGDILTPVCLGLDWFAFLANGANIRLSFTNSSVQICSFCLLELIVFHDLSACETAVII